MLENFSKSSVFFISNPKKKKWTQIILCLILSEATRAKCMYIKLFRHRSYSTQNLQMWNANSFGTKFISEMFCFAIGFRHESVFTSNRDFFHLIIQLRSIDDLPVFRAKRLQSGSQDKYARAHFRYAYTHTHTHSVGCVFNTIFIERFYRLRLSLLSFHTQPVQITRHKINENDRHNGTFFWWSEANVWAPLHGDQLPKKDFEKPAYARHFSNLMKVVI